MFDKIVEACQFLLHNYPEAQEAKAYLDSRINNESQNRFQFGYFPDIKNLDALISLVGIECLESENLSYVKNIEDSLYPRTVRFTHFDNHPLIMPFKNPYGEAVGLVGRSTLPEEEMKKKKIQKYRNTETTKYFKKSNCLFGLYENKQSILQNNLVYVVEGQFDVIKATECGLTNIVGLGTNSMTPYQFSVISRYTDNIILLLDNDEEGFKGRARIAKQFGSFANIQNFYLPDGYKDIDEYLSKNSYESLSFVVKN